MSWATDAFYSHFPSYSGQGRKALDKARQEEYNTYLKKLTEVSNTEKLKRAATEREFRRNIPLREPVPQSGARADHIDSELVTDRSLTSRNDDSLWHESDNFGLPDILNDEIIKRRNRDIAEEQRLKRLTYQQELQQQIEQKRKEKELRKIRERDEEEKLTKKLEEQLRQLKIQVEIEKSGREYKNVKHINKNDGRKQKEQSQQVPLIKSSLELHDPIEPNIEITQRAHNKDNEIYKYFSNSGYEDNDMKSNRFPEPQNAKKSTNRSNTNPYLTYPLKSSELCDSCRSETELEECNFCQECRTLFPNQLNAIGMPMICQSCFTQPICLCCGERICLRCKRPTINKSIESPRRMQPKKNVTPRKRITIHVESKNENTDADDIPDSSSRQSTENTQSEPFSFDVDTNSMFHPSYNRAEKKLPNKLKKVGSSVTNNDMNELKKLTNDKLSKIAKNYGDMRARIVPRDKTNNMDNYPLPLIPPNVNLSSKYSQEDDSREHNSKNTFAFKQLEERWQIPAVERNRIVQNNQKKTNMVTQAGAFKKLLQMDKLRFDDDDDVDDIFKF